MSVEDISPSALPYSSRMREFAGTNAGPHPEVADTVFHYVDIAKRMLLELRVRDFTASEVVFLAGVMEARDREINKGYRKDFIQEQDL